LRQLSLDLCSPVDDSPRAPRQPGERLLDRLSEHGGVERVHDRLEHGVLEQILPESDAVDTDRLAPALRIEAGIVRHGTPRTGETPAPEICAYRPAARAAPCEPDEEIMPDKIPCMGP